MRPIQKIFLSFVFFCLADSGAAQEKLKVHKPELLPELQMLHRCYVKKFNPGVYDRALAAGEDPADAAEKAIVKSFSFEIYDQALDSGKLEEHAHVLATEYDYKDESDSCIKIRNQIRDIVLKSGQP